MWDGKTTYIRGDSLGFEEPWTPSLAKKNKERERWLKVHRNQDTKIEN